MSDEDFRIFIGGEEYKFFTNVTVNLKYDSVASTFAIDSNFLNTPEQREILRPLQYRRIEIFVGDPIRSGSPDTSNLILTGIILKHSLSSKSEPGGIKISGYSLPGVLADSEISNHVSGLADNRHPAFRIPAQGLSQLGVGLEDNNKTLREITEKIIAPFGVELFVNQIAAADADRTIEKASANDTENAASYITKLASQFNIVVGHSRFGRLLFTRVRANERERANYIEGQGAFDEVSLEANGQAINSSYTILRQPAFLDAIEVNPEETIYANIVPAFRPRVKRQSTGGEGDLIDAARGARMEGFRNAVNITLNVTTLRFQDGSIIKPNRVVSLTAPSVYLSQKTSIFVYDVTLSQTSTGVRASMKCCLREAMTGEQVDNIF